MSEQQVAPETAEPSPESETTSLMDEVQSLIDSTTLEDATSELVEEEEESSTEAPEPEPEEPGPEPEPEEPEPESVEEPNEEEEVVDPFDSKGVQKRITGLIDRANKAEQESDSLRQELEQAQTQQPAKDSSPQPLQDISSQKELDKLETNVKQLHYWLLENPDGGLWKDSSQTEHEITYEDAKKLRVSTARDLADNIPARRKQIDTRHKATAVAVETFPWMKDQKSTEYQQVVEILANDQTLQNLYQTEKGPLIAGYLIEGIKSVEARSKKPAATTKPPSVPSASATAPITQKSSQTKQHSALRERAMKTGNRGDVANYLESIL